MWASKALAVARHVDRRAFEAWERVWQLAAEDPLQHRIVFALLGTRVDAAGDAVGDGHTALDVQQGLGAFSHILILIGASIPVT